MASGLEDSQGLSLCMRVVRSDYSRNMNCPIPLAHCMLGLLAENQAYELGQLGTGLFWAGNNVAMEDGFFLFY